jgi:O-acetyl-ADP-ribose deacetylase (regulator of RNase III)
MRSGIELVRGDITTLSVDAIVNAANPGLTPGGAVGMAIHRAAGPELKAECMSLMRGCHPGDAVITGAYRLPARYVIHAVGPSWHGGGNEEAERLASTYRRCFALAEEHGVRTIAFPAISCGLYTFPVVPAAEIAIRESAAALDRSAIGKVTFALFTSEVYDAFAQALRDYARDDEQVGVTEAGGDAAS